MLNIRVKITKLMFGVSNDMVLMCKGEMLNHNMDISMLVVYAQLVEDEKKQ